MLSTTFVSYRKEKYHFILITIFHSGFGLLRRLWDEDKPTEQLPFADEARRTPTIYTIQRASEKNFDDLSGRDSGLGNSRNPTPGDNRSDRVPITLRNNTNRTEKNLVWVYPSALSKNISKPDTNLPNLTSSTASDNPSDLFPLTVCNRANKNKKNLVWIQPSPRLENANEPGNSKESTRSATDSDMNLDLSSMTSPSSTTKKRKNIARVHPLA